MGEIRSAIDIAMEKAAGITGDPDGAQTRLIKNNGIKAASQFLEDGNTEIFEQAFASLSAEDKKTFCNGAYSILFTVVKIPDTVTDLAKMDTAAQGIACLCRCSELQPLMQQVSMIFNQYLHEKGQLKENLARQFTPKLHQKELELARLYGQGIHLEPEQDPEFADLLRKQNQQLSARYTPTLQEIYTQLGVMTGFKR